MCRTSERSLLCVVPLGNQKVKTYGLHGRHGSSAKHVYGSCHLMKSNLTYFSTSVAPQQQPLQAWSAECTVKSLQAQSLSFSPFSSLWMHEVDHRVSLSTHTQYTHTSCVQLSAGLVFHPPSDYFHSNSDSINSLSSAAEIRHTVLFCSLLFSSRVQTEMGDRRKEGLAYTQTKQELNVEAWGGTIHEPVYVWGWAGLKMANEGRHAITWY